MRHREHPTAVEALEDWKALRRKVDAEGGQHYEQPVLVRFADRSTFEVMDRDIVEDEFYVRRPFKVLRALAPNGADLEQALREFRGQTRPGPSGRQGPPRKTSQLQSAPPKQGKPGKPGASRRGRSRRGARRGKPKGPGPGQG